MNVYAHGKGVFDEHAVDVGELFAVPAAIAVQNAQVLAQAKRLATNLQAALVSRAVIDQAMGIVDEPDREHRGGGVRSAAEPQPGRTRQGVRGRAIRGRRRGPAGQGTARHGRSAAADLSVGRWPHPA